MEKNIITLLLVALTNANLILNGNFESPQIPKGSCALKADNWTGTNYNLEKQNRMGATQGQYIDLRVNNSLTGTIGQTITVQQ